EDYRFEYYIPYKISYDTKTEVVSVHEAYVNRSYESLYKYINRYTPLSCMVNYLYLDKSYNKKDYVISLDLKTNFTTPLEDVIHSFDDDGNIVDLDFIKCIAIIYRDEITLGFTPLSMKSYDDKEDTYVFETTLDTDTTVYNNSIDITLQDTMHHISSKMNIPTEGLRIEIVTYQSGLYISDIDGGNYPGYPLFDISNIFEFKDIELFKNVSHLVTTQSYRPNNNQYMLSNIPMVQKEYLEKTGDSVFRYIDEEMNYMETKYVQTEQNYALRLIFSNTYGKSTIFKAGLFNELLSRVNLSMNFRIRLVKGSKIDAQYIRNYIVGYLNGIDFLNLGEFHISGLIDSIKDDLEDVVFIEFENMNEYDYDIQYIHPDIKKFYEFGVLPDVVNISRVWSDDDEKFIPDIMIELV
ncbi:MAG: hypothetical protein ACRCZ9_11300, partial [Fusobacteriaceae bacterium]